MRPALLTALAVGLAAALLAFVQLRLGWAGGGLGLRLAPYQAPVLAAGHQLSAGLGGFFRSQSRLSRENEILRQRVLELEAEQARARTVEEENARLASLLELRQDRLSEGVAARVAARDPSSWFTEVVVDRGSRQGVAPDMVALVPQGVVGRVVEVADSSARVRFLLDPNSAVPVMLEHSKAVGILYGESGYNCTVRFLDHAVAVKEGERVLTSGLGDVFPRGLVVGRVVRNYGRTEALFQSVQVRPEADFGRLHEVLLVGRRP